MTTVGREFRGTSLTGLLVKIALLGLTAALAVWAIVPLIGARAWIGVGAVALATALLFWIYLSPKRLPLKYLVPGTILLLVFQVAPVLYTVATSTSNFGDGHRGTKDDAITAIETASVTQVPDSPVYDLAVATDGDGDLVFILSDPATGKFFAGDAEGLRELPATAVHKGLSGKITEADGYTVLTTAQAAGRSADITALAVPVDGGGIRSNGLTKAYQGVASRAYDASCDCVREPATGKTWTADGDTGYFTAADGEVLPQGWRVSVGLENYTRVITDERVRGPFLSVLWWNFLFAFASVLVTFALGLGCALALHKKRLKGKAVYRTLLVLPYAMPAFAMLLVWRDMFNKDFGLINTLLGLDVGWFDGAWTARAAVVLVQLWLGYPYMFLVCTGALQSIPSETLEAAKIDGASPWQSFRRVTLPLLLVSLTPLLISSFAFNFNNFNAIQLTTGGAPFAPGSSQVGATDLLITYTYRLAFGGQGAQYGFAAACSVFIFLIVATVSVIGFRRTRAQEEVYR
ncbi:sugar ABC transporter permease [Actinorhabdospora filicis]|uniref:Maltose/maltodextrin transport system permease protein n=1 Tax=Actinorhabdospora filicis TaxID=1785913 RepID=A0A9W6W5F2_9ACTN|nr:ABC transporter permease subunit [Actinorhabdospora filicis]GLZ80317.1 sugar ABC transporter permease [Actinorhabdospora filicis]